MTDRRMTKLLWSTWTWIFVALGSIAYAQNSLPRMSERNLRRVATFIVAPQFPEEDIRMHKIGVVVAEIKVDEKGKLSKITILEAPSDTIAVSLSKALSQWRFAAGTVNGQPSGAVGKVTYYFVFQQGKPVVLSPEEAPYLGPLPSNGQ
jgi:TonB family protein